MLLTGVAFNPSFLDAGAFGGAVAASRAGRFAMSCAKTSCEFANPRNSQRQSAKNACLISLE